MSCLRALLQFEGQVQSHYLMFPSAEVPMLSYSKNDCVQPSVMKIKHMMIIWVPTGLNQVHPITAWGIIAHIAMALRGTGTKDCVS